MVAAITALFQRAGRYAAVAPASAALAAAGAGAGATSYLGQRGSATATARTASSAAASAIAASSRCSSSSSTSSGAGTAVRGTGLGAYTTGQHGAAAPTMTTTTTTWATKSSSAAIARQVQVQQQRRTLSATAATNNAERAAIKQPKSSVGGGGGGSGILAWYESYLASHPIPTKMVSGAILWGIGDIVAQVVPVVTHPDDSDNVKFDPARLARASVFGFALHAPIAHLHYNFLEYMTVRSGITGGVKVPVFKAFMEQFVYWSWFSNSLYHGTMGLMQGWSFQHCYDRIADVLWDTQKAQWAFWIPVQLVNFRFVPVRHQLNVVLLTSVVWTALLSAWYPPGGGEGEAQEVEVGEKKKD